MRQKLACLLLAATMMLAAVANAETYALIVGINDYPEPLDAQGNPLKDDEGNVISDDLFGCVNDSMFWKDMLKKNFGVKEENIHLLLDKNATEANFIKEFRWLIDHAKAGDKVFFSYSGHGAQVELDDQPEEADGLTEVICLQDILIPDNFFADIVKVFRDAGVDSTFVFDSCFSGGIDRNADEKWVMRTKRLPATRLSAKQRSNHLTPVEAAELSMAVKMSRGTKKGTYAFLMASQEDQTSSDLQFKDGSPSHGAFTFLLQAILQDNPTTNIQELIETAKALLEKYKFKQIPRAEFSDSTRPKKPVIIGS